MQIIMHTNRLFINKNNKLVQSISKCNLWCNLVKFLEGAKCRCVKVLFYTSFLPRGVCIRNVSRDLSRLVGAGPPLITDENPGENPDLPEGLPVGDAMIPQLVCMLDYLLYKRLQTKTQEKQ